jgi:hypothetical protein
MAVDGLQASTDREMRRERERGEKGRPGEEGERGLRDDLTQRSRRTET